MKINVKPAGYLVVGGQRFVDRVVNSGEVAQEQAAALGRGSRVEPLHPESLVVELAEALAAMDEAYCNAGPDMSREDRHAGRVALIKARALFARVTGGGAT